MALSRYSPDLFRRSFFGLGLAPIITGGDAGDVTITETGVPMPAGGPAGHTTNVIQGRGPIDLRLRYRTPPSGCVVGSVVLFPQSRIAAADLPDEILTPEDQAIVLGALSSSERQQLAATQASWKAKYPWADPAPLYASFVRYPGGDKVGVWVVRPGGYDPELTRYAPIQPGTPQGKVFSAAYAMFFPDHLTPQSFAQAFSQTGSKAGSILPDGPFPYWVKMIRQNQVAAVAQYAQTEPNAFGIGAGTGGGGGPNILLDSLMHGLAAGASTANPYVAAGAAVATAIWEGISALFSSSPSEPAWLTNLKKTAIGRPGDFGSTLLGLSNVGGSFSCRVAWIHSGGDYTIFEAFDAVVRALGGTGAAAPKSWLWIVLGAGAAALLGT